jgi:hypothetical protein
VILSSKNDLNGITIGYFCQIVPLLRRNEKGRLRRTRKRICSTENSVWPNRDNADHVLSVTIDLDDWHAWTMEKNCSHYSKISKCWICSCHVDPNLKLSGWINSSVGWCGIDQTSRYTILMEVQCSCRPLELTEADRPQAAEEFSKDRRPDDIYQKV